MRKPVFLILMLTIIIPLTQFFLFTDTVEAIYAIVNDEIITYSEIENFRTGMTAELRTRFSGAELENEISKMNSNLLDLLIGRKVLLSKAKEKNYDLNQYLDLVIKDIMERNNIGSRDELIAALKSQGISFEEFKEQRLEQLMQERFIQESLGSRIMVDTSEIISYYKKNIEKYTTPEKYKLNCIFLNKDRYFTSESIESKKKEISEKLADSGDFIAVAKEYSELETESGNYELGTFSKGELDKQLEDAVVKLSVEKYSEWIETDSGWYIVQLVDRTEPRVTEYKNVKKEIENELYEEKRQKEVIKLVEELKKESYIKILKEFK